MFKPVAILFGAAWTCAAAWACGRVVLQRLRLRLARGEEHLIAFVVGSGLLSLILFALAALGQINDTKLTLLGAVLIAAAFATGAWRSRGEPLAALPRAWRWIFGTLFGVFALYYVAQAMSPEMSPDGSTYHLGVVARYYRAHGMGAIPENMYAHLSQGLEMLFLMAYAFGRQSGAALVHCAFLLALPLMIVCFGRRFGVERAAAAGALFVFLSPVVGIDGASAYNDVAVACVLFAIFYLLEIWRMDHDARWMVPVGILAGFAYALKYTAFLGAVYAAAVAGLHWWRSKERDWRPAAFFAAGVIALAGPWMLRNWIWFGNPFSPLANRFFPNPFIHLSFEQAYTESLRRYVGLDSYAMLPLELAVRGGILGGLLGPLFLLAPAALLAARTPLGRRVLAAAVLFSLPFAANVGTRFLIPGLPFLALALALAFAAVPPLLMALALAHGVASLPPVVPLYSAGGAWRVDKLLWKQALRIEKQDEFLWAKSAPFRHALLVDHNTPESAVVLSFSPYAEAYSSRENRVGYQSARNELMRETLLSALITDWQPVNARVFLFPPTKVRRLRVVQTAGGSVDLWTVHEFRIYSGERELERRPEWRLRARPNPWDVQLAFDNSPATRWRSWQRIAPGMFLDVDMGREETIDGVSLEGSTDQYTTRLRLEAMDGGGQWRPLGGEPADRGLAPPLGMRGMATEELRRNGITHLLVTPEDFGYADIEENAAMWSMEKIGEDANARLYRLR